MDIIKTFFDRTSKCNLCFRLFELIQKRRKCKVCSKSYAGKIFCKYCSTKVNKGFLSQRYCNDCYYKTVLEKDVKFESMRSQSLKKRTIAPNFERVPRFRSTSRQNKRIEFINENTNFIGK